MLLRYPLNQPCSNEEKKMPTNEKLWDVYPCQLMA